MLELLSQRRQWQPTPVLLPGKSHGWRSLVGCSPCGCYELDTTEWLQFRFSLSCSGEGNGNPLQCSCLENPKDGGVWWAAICGVAQSWSDLAAAAAELLSKDPSEILCEKRDGMKESRASWVEGTSKGFTSECLRWYLKISMSFQGKRLRCTRMRVNILFSKWRITRYD